MKRNIIRIDEEKCTGCGLCIPNCAEGSLEIRNGKAVLVGEALCDGLGACLGHCPEGALTLEVREAEAFDEDQVHEHLAAQKEREGQALAPRGCPSSQAEWRTPAPPPAADATDAGTATSALAHWPVQLTLLPPTAPFFQGADLLLSADCAPFAVADFHRRFLQGRVVAVACPKLDDADAHFRKLIEVFRDGGLARVTILRMEVPCCGGLTGMAAQAMEESGRRIPLREIVVGRDGTVQSERIVG